MNPQSSTNRRNPGITLLEVMILIAVLAVLAAVFLPAVVKPRSRSSRISCVSNLKQIGMSTRQWAMDHGDRYPASVATNEGGVLGHRSSHQAWPYWVVLSNEVNTPKVLRCPNDDDKSEAQTFDGPVTDANISYFVGLAADEMKPTIILSGDRNLTASDTQLKPGLYTLGATDALGWAKSMHNECGNLGLSDGSVQQLSVTGLQQYLRDNPQTNRLVIP